MTAFKLRKDQSGTLLASREDFSSMRRATFQKYVRAALIILKQAENAPYEDWPRKLLARGLRLSLISEVRPSP